jgi:MFS family permease
MTPDKPASDWAIITVIAFLGGVVANIIVPYRRGVWGFVGAALVGIFCGGVTGICAQAFGASEGWQWIFAAAAGVFGDRGLSAVLITRSQREEKTVINNTISGGLNNIGQISVNEDQNQNE